MPYMDGMDTAMTPGKKKRTGKSSPGSLTVQLVPSPSESTTKSRQELWGFEDEENLEM